VFRLSLNIKLKYNAGSNPNDKVTHWLDTMTSVRLVAAFEAKQKLELTILPIN